MLLKNGMGDRERLLRYSDIYISYILHAQNTDGTFRNFMSYDRRFLERTGSEDSYGRALWGVGYCLAHPPRTDQRDLLDEIFIRAVGHLDQMQSPRTLAYGVLAITYYLDFKPGDEAMLTLLDKLCDRLVDHYNDSRQEGWDWFEVYLTYSNGIMPFALFRSLHHINKEEVRNAAVDSTNFLAKQTIVDGVLSPIGCDQPFLYRKARPRFDQQPVDVMCKVLLFSEACRHQELQPHCANVSTAFSWFTGQNDMKTPMYNPETGGCFDGLMESGVNRNQGAESLLSYLISRVVVEDFCQEHLGGNCSAPAAPPQNEDEELDSLLSDFALPEIATGLSGAFTRGVPK
jgi:hypothetical protein